MTVPVVNGTSCISLYAHSSELREEAIRFYEDIFGFLLQHEQDGVKYLANIDHTAIVAFIKSESSLLKQKIETKRARLEQTISTNDWRSAESNFALKCSNLNDLIRALKEYGALVQVHPNELYPSEVYTVDPLCNIVGFSSDTNPLTANPPLNKYEDHPKTKVASPLVDLDVSLSSGPKKNIGVMTSGGDAPGMNAVVRAVVRAAIYRGCKPFAIMEGYEGLVRGGDKYIKEMHWNDVRDYLTEGGTNIGTARCKEFRERGGRLTACLNMVKAGIDALIVCGGDGSLTGADLFRSEWPSLLDELLQRKDITAEQHHKHKFLNICGLVGSIDNDMSTTDSTIGAYSALDRICKAIDYIDATANSHSRAFVVEVMGRHCGWLALMAGISTTADYILIPEKPSSSQDWKSQMCNIVSKHRSRGKRKTIVIVAEGAITSSLEPITSEQVKKVLVESLGLDTRITTLGHVQRGGTAVAFDRILATTQGVEAVKAVLESTPDTPSPLIAIDENKLVRKPLVEAVQITKSIASAIEESNFEKAMKLRDSEFIEHLHNFISMNSADHNAPSLPESKRKRIAIVNIGAPAGGMNSAVYAMATYCMSRGHTPYAIHNGFAGLSRHESIKLMNWLEIDGWCSMGGSEIGTNRLTPSETDIGMIAYYFEKYHFDGVILVGGFEAFVSLEELQTARAMYPAFRIPMVLIPATISNNVPGTEYSLGADTCLNSLTDYCDVVKQSASSTRNRVFIIEVQGGNSGYIATYASLSCGAQVSYVPEEGIALEQLEMDIDSLKESFATAKGMTRAGKLILRSSNASDALNTKRLADVMHEEADGEFDIKTAIPGHVQQGGLPSPIDRTRGARYAIKAVQFIEEHTDKLEKMRYSLEFLPDEPEISRTAAVLSVRSSKLTFSPIRQLYDFETELYKRMPKKIHWSSARDIADQLVGRTRIKQVQM